MTSTTILPTVTDTLGRELRDLRISVTDRCNFRCPYCMPAEVFGARYAFLPKPEILTFEEIERLTRLFVDLGARKLRLTGGEPLLRADLPTLGANAQARIDGVDDVALTTNGYLLPRHASALRDAGLDRVTVSLDSLDDDCVQADERPRNQRRAGAGRHPRRRSRRLRPDQDQLRRPARRQR